MISTVKDPQGTPELMVTCEKCHHKYPWGPARSEEHVLRGDLKIPRTVHKVACPECQEPAAVWEL